MLYVKLVTSGKVSVTPSLQTRNEQADMKGTEQPNPAMLAFLAAELELRRSADAIPLQQNQER